MRTWADLGISVLYSATSEVRTSCLQCGSPSPHHTCPGAGPHYQQLTCGQCGAFLRWLPKPHGGAQEVRR